MSDISKFQAPDGTIYDLKDDSARNQIYDLSPVGDVSGNPIIINDGADDVPVKDMTITVEPQQDLHGYDHPWPAGGGKNLLLYPYPRFTSGIYTANGLTFKDNGDGRIIVNGTATANISLSLINSADWTNLPAGSYIFSGSPAVTGCTIYYQMADNGVDIPVSSVAGSEYRRTWENDVSMISGARNIYLSIASGTSLSNAIFEPMIRKSTDSADWEPYSNECPICPPCHENLLNITGISQTINGVTFTVNDDGTVKVNGTATADTSFTLADSMTVGSEYIINGCPIGGSWNTFVLAVNTGAVDAGSGASGASINGKAVFIFVKSGQTVSNLLFKPMIRHSYIKDPTFVPYGYRILTKTVGKNYWNRADLIQGRFLHQDGHVTSADSSTNIAILNYIGVKPSTTYSVAIYGQSYLGGSFVFVYFDKDKNPLNVQSNLTDMTEGVPKTFTTSASTYYVGFSSYRSSSVGGISPLLTADVILCETQYSGSYEPYKGQTFPTALPEPIYSAKVDITTGEMVVDKGIYSVTGNEADASYNWNSYTFGVSGIIASNDGVNVVACSHLQDAVSGLDIYYSMNNTNYPYAFAASLGGMRIRNRAITQTLDAYKTWLQAEVSKGTPVQVIFKLATPLIYHLTPTEVTTLLGHNFISSDGRMELEYCRDTASNEIYLHKSSLSSSAIVSPDEGDNQFLVAYDQNKKLSVNIPQDTYVETINNISPDSGDVVLNATDIPVVGVAVKSVSGNPVSITDAVESDAVDLKVALTPNQELHGYDSPWISSEVDKTPYNFRASSDSIVSDLGTHELDTIVGGTVAWNQKRADTVQSLINTDGITTSYDSSTHLFCIENISRSTPYNTGSTRGTIGYEGDLVAGHKLLVISDKTDPGVGITGGASSSFFIPLNGIGTVPEVITQTYIDLRVTSNYDFVNLHPIGDKFYFTMNVIDLTQMLGTTLADYIYGLESATAGAGIAWLRKHFPKMFTYHAYDAGSLVSVEGLSHHVTTGFNQWDEEVRNGYYDTKGAFHASTGYVANANPIPVLPDTNYNLTSLSGYLGRICWYDADMVFIAFTTNGSSNTIWPARSPKGAMFLNFDTTGTYGGTYKNDICINISDSAKNGTYEPYKGHTYPLDSTKTFRGIFKLDSSNRLYADGDRYLPDGTVVRRYGVVDLGTLNWSMGGSGQFYSASVASTIRKGSVASYSHIRCVLYEAVNISSLSNLDNLQMSVDAGGNIQIRNDAYSTASAFKTAMSGVYLVYELATPTTESATPYTSAQVIDIEGSEEYVSTSIVPVGHESRYANICPITGLDEVKVERTGFNQWDEAWEVGNIDPSTGQNVAYNGTMRAKNHIPVIPNASYYFYCSVTATGSYPFYFYDKDKNYIGTEDIYALQEFVIPNNCHFIRFRTTSGYGNTYKNDICINISDSAKNGTYESYRGTQTVTTDLGRTVYGGTLDVTTGVLTVDKASVDLGTLTWFNNKSGENAYEAYADFTQVKANTVNLMSNALVQKAPYIDVAEYTVRAGSDFIAVKVPIGVANSVESMKQWLIGHNVYLVYELATPQTYTLTPQELHLLEGLNVLTASDGNIMLEYNGHQESTIQGEVDEFEQKMIGAQRSFAFKEDAIASKNYPVGDYLIYLNRLYKITTAISSGDTLVIGENIEPTSIAKELALLNDKIDSILQSTIE